MIDPKLKDWLSKGYAKIGDIAYSIALNMRKGKNQVKSQRDLYEQGIKMSIILKLLFRHVTFDEVTGVPTLWRITEEQVNKFLKCLIQLGELDKYPIVPTLFPTVKPIIVSTGAQGNVGQTGADGDNANIIVQLKPGEDQLILETTVLGLVKTYELSFEAYVKQILSAAIQSGRTFEVGTTQTVTILLTSTKGTREILTLICSNDAATDAALQILFSLIAANNEGAQPYTVSVAVTGQTATKTYIFVEDDGKTPVTASDTVSFYYPYLYGASSTTGINPYSALTKDISGKSNKTLYLNGTDKYFYICYPDSYGALTSIKDQNNFEKITDFTQETAIEMVTSSGLATNWTIKYRIYRTTLKTSINNYPYTITF